MSDPESCRGTRASKGPDLSSVARPSWVQIPHHQLLTLLAVFDPHHGAPKVAFESHHLDFRRDTVARALWLQSLSRTFAMVSYVHPLIQTKRPELSPQDIRNPTHCMCPQTLQKEPRFDIDRTGCVTLLMVMHAHVDVLGRVLHPDGPPLFEPKMLAAYVISALVSS